MVSNTVVLAFLAALASTVNAFFFHVEIIYKETTATSFHYNVHPIDPLIPGNDALVQEGEAAVDPSGTGYVEFLFSPHGYVDFKLKYVPFSGPEVERLVMLDSPDDEDYLTCSSLDRYTLNGPDGTTYRKIYNCVKDEHLSLKGNPATIPTTTTTAPPVKTCPVVTITIPATTTPLNLTTTPPKPTTTKPPTPSPTCLAGYKGKRCGKGPTGACCSHSDDCKDTCVKGKCGRHP